MSIPQIPIDTLAPYALSVPLSSDASGWDLTAITAVSFEVLRTDGTEATWAASMAPGSTPTDGVALHPWASGDLTVLGLYTVKVSVTIGGQTCRLTNVAFEVVGAWSLPPNLC